jgi:hypothetical protein
MLSRFPVYHYPEKGNLSGGGEGVRRELCLKFPYYVREYGTDVFSLPVVCSLIAHAGEEGGEAYSRPGQWTVLAYKFAAKCGQEEGGGGQSYRKRGFQGPKMFKCRRSKEGVRAQILEMTFGSQTLRAA